MTLFNINVNCFDEDTKKSIEEINKNIKTLLAGLETEDCLKKEIIKKLNKTIIDVKSIVNP